MTNDTDNSETSGNDSDLPLITKRNNTVNQSSLIWRILRRIRFLPLVMLFGATIGVIALYFQPPGLQKLMGVLQLEPGGGTSSPIAIPANPADDDKPINADPKAHQIVGLGKLLPEGDIRTVAPPFGAGDARIAKLHVAEGDRVLAGDKLATLDNETNIKAIIENANSTVSVRRATLNQIKNSVLISRDEARASLSRAISALQNAQAEFERTDALFKRGFTTNSVLDKKLSTRDQAEGDVRRLKATLARFESSNIEEQPDVLVAARNLDAALSDLARAKSDLSKSQVHAPTSGTILNIHAHPGERPGTSGILDIGNIEKMTADIEIYQTQIGAIHRGATVELTADALAMPLIGIVTKIGLEVGSQKLIDSNPAANTDARVVVVTVTLDEPSSQAAKRYTNLQVLARISVKPQ